MSHKKGNIWIVSVLMLMLFSLFFCCWSAFAEETEYQELTKGSKGKAVKQLETRLRELGYFKSGADNSFTSSTTEAVMSFQARNGIQQDGIATVETQKILFSDNARRAPEPPGVSISDVRLKKSSVRFKLTNNLKEAVDDIWVYIITFDKDGKVYASNARGNSESNPLYYVWTNYVVLKPGKTSSKGNIDVSYASIIDTAAIGVAQYHTASGKRYIYRPEQVTYVKNDGTVINPTDDDDVFCIEDLDYYSIKDIDLGAETHWISPYTEEIYGYPAGKYIESVVSGGVYDKAGIKSEDVIISYDGNKGYWRYADLLAKQKIKNGEAVEIQYIRGGETFTTQLGVPVEEEDDATSTSSIGDELLKYGELLEKGLITQDEYDVLKKKLIYGE